MKTYPYSQLPSIVAKYQIGEIVDLSDLDLPSNPILKKYDYGGYLIGLISSSVIVLLIIFGVSYWIIYPVLAFISFWGISSSISDYKSTKLRNHGFKSRYQEELKSINAENQKREHRRSDLEKNNTKGDYIKDKIKEILCDYTKPDLITWQTKKGLSESFFIKFLFQYFKEDIKPFTKLYDSSSFSYDYQPDFVFQNSKICIDIEIDEPYVMEGRKPIHFLDEETDSYRDDFFTCNNWCVIRFCEEQVLMQPYECCKYIAQTIYDLTGESKYLRNLAFVGMPKPTSKWTKAEAEKMSIEKYRELLFLKAHHQASQLEYFAKNYFEDTHILITKISDWKDHYHLCFNNNFNGPKTLAFRKTLFPAFTHGETIELELDKFALENDYIIHMLPAAVDDTLFERYEEYKEQIVRIDKLKS